MNTPEQEAMLNASKDETKKETLVGYLISFESQKTKTDGFFQKYQEADKELTRQSRDIAYILNSLSIRESFYIYAGANLYHVHWEEDTEVHENDDYAEGTWTWNLVTPINQPEPQ